MRDARRESAKEWWAERRVTFNAVLIAAGLFALIRFYVLSEVRCAAIPGSTVAATPLAVLAHLAGVLVVLGLANLAYRLGPRLERRLAPARVDGYRRWAYRLGLAGVLVVLLVVPAFVYPTC